MDSAPGTGPACWPFLIARGRTVGYRVVLAPPFLVEGRLTGLLMDASAADAALGESLARREVHHPVTGAFTAVFRTVAARRDLVGEPAADGSTDLLDEASRPIQLTQGIVFRTSAAEAAIDTFTLRLLDEVTADAYRTFWHADDPTTRPRPSQPLSGGQDDGKNTVEQVHDLPPLELGGPPAGPREGRQQAPRQPDRPPREPGWPPREPPARSLRPTPSPTASIGLKAVAMTAVLILILVVAALAVL